MLRWRLIIRGAGTVEGLLQDGEYFFLEMNTRVQVEHCVTEMVTGVDIVKEGIRVAAARRCRSPRIRFSFVVMRLSVGSMLEDASRDFAPAPGRISGHREPSGPGVRVDSGVMAGSLGFADV